MVLSKLYLLNKLRTAVKKISFLLNLNVNRFRIIASIISNSAHRNRLSFNNRPVGLQACVDDFSQSESSSPMSTGLLRTTSYPSSEDDIDIRAEMFIANFYRQLQMERQVSLELRYARDNNFDSVSP